MSEAGAAPQPWRTWARQLGWFLLPFASLTLLSIGLAAWDVHVHRAPDFFQAMFPALHDGWDLTGFQERFDFDGSAAFFQPYSQSHPDAPSFNYAAPLAIITRLLFNIPVDAAWLCRAILAAWLLVLGSGFTVACRRRGARVLPVAIVTAVVLASSRPTVLLGFTANLELFVWMATATGVSLWATDRSAAAGACFGLAGAMKYFPILSLGLFLTRRKWSAVLLGLAVCAGAMLAGLWLLGPTIPVAFHGLSEELARFTGHYLLRWERTDNGYDHSVFGVVKLLLVSSGHEAALSTALRIYTLAVAAAVPLLYFLRIRQLRQIDQLIVFSILAVWLAPMSQDYTLVHLMAPFGCLLLDRLCLGWKRGDTLRLACFGVIFSALDFIHIGPARLGGNVKAVVLALLLVATLRQEASDGDFLDAQGLSKRDRCLPLPASNVFE